MKNTINLYVKTDSGGEAPMDHYSDSPSTPNDLPELSSRFRRLGQWLAARIEAHYCRVSELRVYRR